jgi:DNA-binding transcriptional regulator YhcF (GntR family)
MSILQRMTMWLPKMESRRGPVYRAIADAIDEDVQNGMLRAGTRLPPHRDLADHLGVTVTTITRAYTEAARRGLTTGHVGRGTFIRGNEPDDRATESAPFDLTINILMPRLPICSLVCSSVACCHGRRFWGTSPRRVTCATDRRWPPGLRAWDWWSIRSISC